MLALETTAWLFILESCNGNYPQYLTIADTIICGYIINIIFLKGKLCFYVTK